MNLKILKVLRKWFGKRKTSRLEVSGQKKKTMEVTARRRNQLPLLEAEERA